jgi:hypothetical protein
VSTRRQPTRRAARSAPDAEPALDVVLVPPDDDEEAWQRWLEIAEWIATLDALDS